MAALWLAAVAVPPARAQNGLQAGSPAPSIELPVRTGNPPWSLEGARGKVVLIAFWASWCPSCQQLFPWLNEVQAKYGAQGVQVVGIGLDARQAEAEGFLQQHRADFPVLLDPAVRVPRAYDVQEMPTLVLVDAGGRVRWVHPGFAPADQAGLDRDVRAALAAH